MARTKRERVWEGMDAPVLEAFEAVRPALANAVLGQPQALESGINWSGSGAHVDDVTDVRASVDRVGIRPLNVTIRYGRRVDIAPGTMGILDTLEGPLHGITLTTWYSDFQPVGTSVTLSITGDDTDLTHGFFNSACNQVDAAVERLKKPTPAEVAHLAARPTGWRGRLGAVLRHPTGSQIVGGLAVAAVIALITWALAAR